MTVITSVKVEDNDYKFCKDNKLQFTALLKEVIFSHRQVVEGLIVDNVFEERRKREKFQQISEELRDKCSKLQTELQDLKR